MSDDWKIDAEDFERLLTLLAQDRDAAAERYVTIQRGLVKMFAGRRCHEAEDLADETMFRVARKTRTLRKYTGDFAFYIYRVARFIHLEWLRRSRRAPPDPPPAPPAPDEIALSCQDECLAALPADDRELVVGYHQRRGREKIENRRELARKSGLSANALRIKVFKLRALLRDCIEECVARQAG